jgi:hypothetical protein
MPSWEERRRIAAAERRAEREEAADAVRAEQVREFFQDGGRLEPIRGQEPTQARVGVSAEESRFRLWLQNTIRDGRGVGPQTADALADPGGYAIRENELGQPTPRPTSNLLTGRTFGTERQMRLANPPAPAPNLNVELTAELAASRRRQAPTRPGGNPIEGSAGITLPHVSELARRAWNNQNQHSRRQENTTALHVLADAALAGGATTPATPSGQGPSSTTPADAYHQRGDSRQRGQQQGRG